MYRYLAAQTITVRRGGKDRYGDTLPTTDHQVEGCIWAPTTSTEANDASVTTTTGLTLYAPYGADIRATDAVLLPGDAVPWYVNGDPFSWQNPFTALEAGTEVTLTRTKG